MVTLTQSFRQSSATHSGGWGQATFGAIIGLRFWSATWRKNRQKLPTCHTHSLSSLHGNPDADFCQSSAIHSGGWGQATFGASICWIFTGFLVRHLAEGPTQDSVCLIQGSWSAAGRKEPTQVTLCLNQYRSTKQPFNKIIEHS